MSKKHKQKHLKVGMPPESPIYTGKASVADAQVIVVQYGNNSIVEHKLEGHNYMPWAEDKVTWYDVKGLNDEALVEHLGQTFDVHSLAIEDILNTSQRPKWEDYDNGIFIIVRALRFDKNIDDFIAEQVSFYLEKYVLLTFQEDADDLFVSVRERLHYGQGKIRQRGADFLVYTLMDCIVDNYIYILDNLEEDIESLEIQILTNFDPSVRSRIYRLKRQLTEIRRAILPLRDVVSRFSREEGEFIHPSNQIYIRDLYDHVVRVIETIENQRDMVKNLSDLFDSEQTNRANHVVKVLTILSAIFIPLTFIAGIYGTNFEVLPELHYHNAYFWMWGIMIVIAIGQLMYFRWKKWL